MTAFWIDHPRDMLRVSGDDAQTYLQSQISQDIRDLADGESTYTFVLQPTGKVEALARIRRVSATEFSLDTDAGFGEALRTRLARFKIRVKADLEVMDLACVAVRDADGPRPDEAVSAWGRQDAYDLFGAAAPTAVANGSAHDLLRARIEAGWPAMGAEITDATIPAESGVVDLAVSFTKGCYPGQELVERMDSRGSTAPRFVRRLSGTGAIADELTSDGKVVGHVTSSVSVDDGWIGLGIVARSVQPGDIVQSNGGAVTVAEAR